MTEKNNFQIMPHDIEAECAVLGAVILSSGNALGEVANILSAGDFYDPNHEHIFKTVTKLHAEGRPVDMVNLKAGLEQSGKLEQVGGIDGLMELCESVPNALSARHYAGIVKSHSDRRKIIQLAWTASQAAYAAHDEPAEVSEQLQSGLVSFASDSADNNSKNLSGEVAAVFDRLEKLAEGEDIAPPLKTGLANLDMLTGGLHAGQLVILAAGTGRGKTALALHIALHSALNENKPVAMYSLEMSRRQLAERVLAHESGVDLSTVRGLDARSLERDTFGELAGGVGRLNGVGIYPIHYHNLTAEKIAASSRYLQQKNNIGLVVVDYLQLIASNTQRGRSRNDEVAAQSRALKLLALELDIPILCLSQLNRSSARDQRRPRLCDLRDSGAIEQDADTVMFIFDPNAQGESPGEGYTPDAKDLELIIAKQRQGATGCVKLRFDGAVQRFSNLTQTGGVNQTWT